MFKISEKRMKSYSYILESFSIHKIKKAMNLLNVLQRNEEEVFCHRKTLWDSVMCGNEKRAIENLTTDVHKKLRTTYFRYKRFQKQRIIEELLTSKIKTLEEAITINQKAISIMVSDGYEFRIGGYAGMQGWTWGLYATSD